LTSYYCYLGAEKGVRISAEELAQYDVVLTNYDVLRKEVHLTTEDNQRSRRHKRVYDRSTTPLTHIRWWRVCLDEAQMVENTMANASGMLGNFYIFVRTAILMCLLAMARQIPREHPWAVTGTPVAKTGLGDLYGLVHFLDYQPLSTKWSVFSRMLEGPTQHYFVQAIAKVMHRNSKELVKDELSLPPQSSLTINLDLSGIERTYYDELMERCIDEVKRECERLIQLAQSVAQNLARPEKDRPKREKDVLKEYEESKSKLRSWFLQLRQTWYALPFLTSRMSY
jgi:E3 ubiquitin-protein ligase SHPRH